MRELNGSCALRIPDKIIKVIRKNIFERYLQMISDIADNKEQFYKIYETIGKNLKLGIHQDATNRNKPAELLRHHYTKSGDGADLAQGLHHPSPFLARLKKKGYDDLLMTDLIGAYALDDDLSEDEKKSFEELTKTVKAILGDKVEKVILSKRIVGSPCVLVTGQFGWSANVERIIKAQVLRDSNMSQYMASKKTLELNAHNAIVKKLPSKASQDQSDPTVHSAGRLNNLISFGSSIDDAGVEDNAAKGSKKDGAAAEGAGESAMESID
ncbi:hypothetical protein CF319_g8200 [Tilletia indica]|nr:hypothetical protein CF319_g8200 [Tilletia indica]